MTTLADAIWDGLSHSTVTFPDENIDVPLSDLWNHGCNITRLHRETEQPLAMLLSNSADCVAALLGAIQAGLTLISLPPPARGVDLRWYAAFISRICKQHEVSHLLAEPSTAAALNPLMEIRIHGFADALCATDEMVAAQPHGFELIQFTSGSTSDPKGVVLSQAKILANILAILDRLQMEAGDGSCSWLPMSHDMGLIGMSLSSFVAGQFVNDMRTVILKPDSFLRRPSRWLNACGKFGSTITCVPNMGLEMAMRQSSSNLDLSLMPRLYRRCRSCQTFNAHTICCTVFGKWLSVRSPLPRIWAGRSSSRRITNLTRRTLESPRDPSGRRA